MTTDDKERDFNEQKDLKRSGRLDFKVLNNINDAGDSFPGLQKMVRNWVNYYLSQGIIEDVLNLNTKKITDVLNPTDDQDLYTKSLIDSVIVQHINETNDHIDNLTDITTRNHSDIQNPVEHHTLYTDAEVITALGGLIGSDGKIDTIFDLDGNAFDNVNKIVLDEIAEPSTVGSHSVLYVDSTKHMLLLKDINGIVKTLGNWKGFFGGGQNGGWRLELEWFDIITTSNNASNRGDLLGGSRGYAGGNHIRGHQYGFFVGGSDLGTESQLIDYVNLVITVGNGLDKGDLVVGRERICCVSGNIYGFAIGKDGEAGYSVDIEYIDLTTAIGNATDGGDLTVGRDSVSGMYGDTYGFFAGGYNGTILDIIDYINLSSASGSATDKGDLLVDKRMGVGVSGTTYGFYCGGSTSVRVSVIEYIDLTTAIGNATDGGDLTQVKNVQGGVSSRGSSNYGFVICGEDNGGDVDVIEYIDITSSGSNGVDKGDAVFARNNIGAF